MTRRSSFARSVTCDPDCRYCDGSGRVTTIERSPGSLYGYREVDEQCPCALEIEPDCDGPDPFEDRSTGNEEVDW